MNKKILFLLCLILFIVSVAGVSATEDINQIDINTNDLVSGEDTSGIFLSYSEIQGSSGAGTFSDLQTIINEAEEGSIINLTMNYSFNSSVDTGSITIAKQLTIDGNSYTINGNNESGAFHVSYNHVALKNIEFSDCFSKYGGAVRWSGDDGAVFNCSFIKNTASYGGAIFQESDNLIITNNRFIQNSAESGGAICSIGQITLNNVTFISNNAGLGGAIEYYDKTLNCNNSRFIDNSAGMGSAICSDNAKINVCNSFFTSIMSDKFGQISASSSTVNIDNSQFINISSTYAPALYFGDSESLIINSRFINLTANITAGGIAVRWSGNSYIKGCEFINTKSFKNAGAILVNYGYGDYNATIIECVFKNTSSMIGGAYMQLGGILVLNDSNFTNSKASCDGGAVYLSFTISEIDNCLFTSNMAGFLNDRPAYGGAVYCDFCYLKIDDSEFINNSAYRGNAIYVCDSSYGIADCLFANNTNAIFTDFDDGPCNLINNDYNNDTVITNKSFSYLTFIDTPVLNLTLINNTINVTGLPSRFDLREWGLVSSVKNQGRICACHTFAIMGAVESALLKAYGMEFDLSEGNLFHNMLRYSLYGNLLLDEWASPSFVVSYLLDWYGPALEEKDVFDEVGKLSPFRTSDYNLFHIQDMIIVSNDEVPECSRIKTAILKYGALYAGFFAQSDDTEGYYNPKTSSLYVNESIMNNHAAAVIGWDDNFSKDNFLITPPGDGAWIVKNSWGTDWGDNGFDYISYYDKSFLNGEYLTSNAFGFVIENTVPYNKNYQHDFIWSGDFVDMNQLRDVDGNIVYANYFEAAGDDLIAAVGTYFNESGVNYTVEVYVNDELKLIQDGVSPFSGYHTIQLDEYIPVKKGDIFKAVMTSNAMPYCSGLWSRIHYTENVSFFYYDGEWEDLYVNEDIFACLKVYTVEDVNHTINYTFNDLARHINKSADILEIMHDYTFSNESDDGDVIINKSNFIINGNNHILDGNKQSGIFEIFGNNVTINNLVFINGNCDFGGAIYSNGEITLNNVTFINNTARWGGAIYYEDILYCNNSLFIDNSAERGSSIYSDNAEINVCNSFFTSVISDKFGQIFASGSTVNIDNSQFINMSSDYAPAIYFEDSESFIINSRFVNLTANITAGAIAIKGSGNSYIKGSEFINTKSFKNAGAIHVNYGFEDCNTTIIECVFNNTSSGIGGAFIQLGGNLILNNSNFTNNNALYDGCAVYISFTNSQINNCTFDSNGVELLDDYSSCGGAIYCDMSNLILVNSRFINNSAQLGNAVYAYESCYDINYCIFANNTNAIFTNFDKGSCNLENNIYYNDTVITNHSYPVLTFMESHALNLTLIKNTFNVTAPPSRFDLRDWGWITPVKNQGIRGSCWVFSVVESLETAILKATGIRYDASQNNIQNLQVRYSQLGALFIDEGSIELRALGNALSWLGVVPYAEDEYDEVGRLSVFIDCENKISLQDVYFIIPNSTDYVSEVKKAILDYGAVSIGYASSNDAPYFNVNTFAQYTNESIGSNHSSAIIGWDDNFSKDNFLITPPGNGAWIVKNSWGTEWGDGGYFYLSYYEKSFFMHGNDMDINNLFTACIFNNTIDYHVNYQTDFIGLSGFDSNYVQYSNEFTANYDDLIAAVGTYFNQSGIAYSFDVYVNEKLMHSQNGTSEFAGFRTILLNKCIPIKAGDKFKVVFRNNAVPFQEYSRQHYMANMTFVSSDGETWFDFTLQNKTVCLKVYTVKFENQIITEDLVKIYKNDSGFEAQIAAVNETVTFEINGMNYTRISDEKGIAKIAINLNPGNYTIKTTFNGTTVENSITVLPTLIADNLVKYFRNESQFYVSLIDGNGKTVPEVIITMNINGVFYNRTTDGNGRAKLNINLNPGEYILTAIDPLTGLQMSYSITVLPILAADDLNMTYLDGSQFAARLVDGTGRILSGINITFNINGVFYNRTTDENGIAKLNIRLMAGEYIITS